MDKERTSTKKEREVCELCKGTEPWHLIGCYRLGGKHCTECGAIHPRHYPACSQDTIKFQRWWIPEYQRGALLSAYRMMVEEAKFNGTYREPPKIQPQPRFPNERNINPIIGQRIVKALLMMLQSESHQSMLITKKAILAEVDTIAKKQAGEKGEA